MRDYISILFVCTFECDSLERGGKNPIDFKDFIQVDRANKSNFYDIYFMIEEKN